MTPAENSTWLRSRAGPSSLNASSVGDSAPRLPQGRETPRVAPVLHEEDCVVVQGRDFSYCAAMWPSLLSCCLNEDFPFWGPDPQSISPCGARSGFAVEAG